MAKVLCAGCNKETDKYTCVNPLLEETGHPFHLDLCSECFQKYQKIISDKEKELSEVKEKYNKKLIETFDFTKFK